MLAEIWTSPLGLLFWVWDYGVQLHGFWFFR